MKTDGVINLFGDRQIEFSLFDEAFIKEVKNMKERNLAVELLTKLLKEKIKQQQKTNVIQSDLFSDMLSQSLSNYLKGLLTNEEVIEELLKMAQQFKKAEEEGNSLGLSPEEKAFYDAGRSQTGLLRRGVCGAHQGTDGGAAPQPHHRLEPQRVGKSQDACDGEATAQEV